MRMNFEDIILSEISQLQKTNTVWFHFYEVPRAVKFIETESRMVVASRMGRGKWGANVERLQNFSFAR